MSEDKSSSYEYKNMFNVSQSEFSEKKKTYEFYCNVWSCYVCHNDQKRLSPEEIQAIKKRRGNKSFYPKPKRCDGNCNYCNRKIFGNKKY